MRVLVLTKSTRKILVCDYTLEKMNAFEHSFRIHEYTEQEMLDCLLESFDFYDLDPDFDTNPSYDFVLMHRDKERVQLANAILEMHEMSPKTKPKRIKGGYVIEPWFCRSDDMSWVDLSAENIILFYSKTTYNEKVLL
jgi:hypothetical protein